MRIAFEKLVITKTRTYLQLYHKRNTAAINMTLPHYIKRVIEYRQIVNRIEGDIRMAWEYKIVQEPKERHLNGIINGIITEEELSKFDK